MNRADCGGTRSDPEVRRVASGISWPAIGCDAAAAHHWAILEDFLRR